MNFWNRPLNTTEMIVLAIILVFLIFLIRWQAQRRSRGIAQNFLTEHPDAAVLYLYVQDLPRSDGKVVCRKGTVSQVFDAKDAPGFGISKGIACYVIPGSVELDATVSWTKDLYVARRYHNMQARLSFQAESGCGYAAVFDRESQSMKVITLGKKSFANP